MLVVVSSFDVFESRPKCLGTAVWFSAPFFSPYLAAARLRLPSTGVVRESASTCGAHFFSSPLLLPEYQSDAVHNQSERLLRCPSGNGRIMIFLQSYIPATLYPCRRIIIRLHRVNTVIHLIRQIWLQHNPCFPVLYSSYTVRGVARPILFPKGTELDPRRDAESFQLTLSRQG